MSQNKTLIVLPVTKLKETLIVDYTLIDIEMNSNYRTVYVYSVNDERTNYFQRMQRGHKEATDNDNFTSIVSRGNERFPSVAECAFRKRKIAEVKRGTYHSAQIKVQNMHLCHIHIPFEI